MWDEYRRVDITVHYDFLESEQAFRAKLTAYIRDEDGLLPEIYRNDNETFFGTTLGSCWGSRSEKRSGFRYEYTYLQCDDKRELEEKVDYYIKKEINKLREVVKRNLKELRELPVDKLYEFEMW